jgi:hypothetical protein
MHLNFLDTSPLKEFASRLRSKLRVCKADLTLAVLTIANSQDRCLQLTVLTPGMPCIPQVYPACLGYTRQTRSDET